MQVIAIKDLLEICHFILYPSSKIMGNDLYYNWKVNKCEYIQEMLNGQI